MTMTEDPPELVTAELAVIEDNLFRASSPAAVIVAAKQMAQPLGDLIRDRKMVTKIGRNEHTNIEGWQTAGAMLGISAHTVWSRLARGLPEGERGWEARAEARTRSGEILGAAEGMVTNTERNWKGATDQAMRSMAQTRAQSKALASCLRFVMTLTGVSGTPAEEVPDDRGSSAPPAWAAPVGDVAGVAGQLVSLLAAAGHPDGGSVVGRIGQAIFDECDDTIPVCVAHAISLITAAVTTSSGEEGANAATEASPVAADAPGPMTRDAEIADADETAERTTEP